MQPVYRRFLHYFYCWLILSLPPCLAEEIDVVTEVLPPYQIITADGHLSGYATDVVNALFKAAGDVARVQVMPWARAHYTALNHPKTLIYSIARTPQREKSFHWIGILSKERLFVWGLKSRYPQPFSSIEQVKPLTIAVTLQSSADQYFSSEKHANLLRIVSQEQEMGMLYKERIDVIVGMASEISVRASKLGYEFNELQPLFEIPELNRDLYIAFSKGTPIKLVNKYRHAFAKLVSNGSIASLQLQWGIEQ